MQFQCRPNAICHRLNFKNDIKIFKFFETYNPVGEYELSKILFVTFDAFIQFVE